MSAEAFSELSDRIHRLYVDGKYSDAFEAATQAATLYPENVRQIYFWRTCLASRLGQLTLATEILREALHAGHWYPVGRLRGDHDLDPLQGTADFEGLVAICQERQTVAERNARPLLLTFESAARVRPSDGYPLLVVLHANNGTATETAEFWRNAAELGWFVAVPQSSQVYGPDAYVWNDRDRATREVRKHIHDLAGQQHVDASRIVLGGMSKGAETSIFLVLSGIIDARGFIAVGPARLQMPDLQRHAQRARERGIMGSIIVGDKDHLYPQVCEFAETLRVAGVNCSLQVHPGLGHAYPATFRDDLRRALGAFASGS